MHIITTNTCSECCYCMDDYDNFGICCKDNTYRQTKLNKSACRFFCSDNMPDTTEEHNTLMPDNYATELDELDNITDDDMD